MTSGPPTTADPASLIPDLLHPLPVNRIDVDGTRLTVNLAFSSGVSGGLFADALSRTTIAPSDWDPSAFANDLFLRNFVSMCFRVRLGTVEQPIVSGSIVNLLSRPPRDGAVAAHRRAILAELVSSPALRKQVEKLYASLADFRTLLEGATGVGKFDPCRRQLDLLGMLRGVIDRMAEGFEAATSGLHRLSLFARRIQDGEPYQSLCDLLEYDDKLATLDLKVAVGADGRIRGFQILKVEENQPNPFTSSPWRRWLAKIELFLRGYHFDDGEVMARLIDAVFDGVQDEVVRLVQLFGDLELYLGALGFRDQAQAAGLAVCLPELVAPEEPRVLDGLFNPLLLGLGTRVVPCDITIDRHDTTVLVTGPNSGGKTRLLQSIGLSQLLAQAGLFIPARSGRLAPCPGMVVSLIEEAKADQSEGRLGTELMRIRSLFEHLPPGAMVIMDELCSGTNPSEGEEIFELVVRMLSRLKPQALITTHFLAFAARLEHEKKIGDLRFLQVQLGADEKATYQFVPGVACTSLAGQTAARLGVTGEQLMSLIERNIAQAQKPAGRAEG